MVRTCPRREEEDVCLSGLLRGIDGGETLVVAAHAAKSPRSGFLNRVLPALRHDGIRPTLVSSLDGGDIDLASLMDQVIGSVCVSQIERLERCHAALTTLTPAEKRIALVIEDAHLLTEQCFRYLDLVASVTRSGPAPLLLLLVGSPAIWDRLPKTGMLAAENVARRLTLDDATLFDEPERTADHVAAESGGWSSQVVELGRAARILPELILPARQQRGWFALAAFAGSFAMAGGFAVDLYLTRPLTLHTLFPHAMLTQPSSWAESSSAAPIPPPAAAIRQAESALPDLAPERVRFGEVPVQNRGAVVGAAETPPAWTALASGQATAQSVPPLIDVPGTVADDASSVTKRGAGASAATTGSAAMAPPALRIAVPPPVAGAPTAGDLSVSASIAPVSLAPPPMSSGLIAVLIARGDGLLASGDVTAARLMYRRAADAHSVAGTVAMGMTFDPTLLAQIRVQGLAADTQLAAMWYQRAVALGSSDAVRLLRQLDDKAAR